MSARQRQPSGRLERAAARFVQTADQRFQIDCGHRPSPVLGWACIKKAPTRSVHGVWPKPSAPLFSKYCLGRTRSTSRYRLPRREQEYPAFLSFWLEAGDCQLLPITLLTVPAGYGGERGPHPDI